ncbi:MAG: glycoside hydrolase family 43 protein [Mariniblastus sp.]
MSFVENPILKGFNPDPSIIRVGENYYIATSTFEWFPGVQIHHSRDLVNWQLISRPLDRVSQLDMKGVPDSCGVWAPCLSWDNGKFYLVFTNVRSFDGRWKDTLNFLVTAESIDGPWSDPIRLPNFGFDPSLFHDDDGRKWFTSMIVDHRSENFFGGIVLQEYDPVEQKCIGTVEHIFEGTELGLTEAPHIYRRDGFYYLVVAEGGTEYGHAVSVARSKSLGGPYEVHPDNPIITCADLPDHSIQKSGHGDIVESPTGELFIVFLMGRPLTTRGRCTLGRETAIEELVWPKGGWPRLKSGARSPRLRFEMPSVVDVAEGLKAGDLIGERSEISTRVEFCGTDLPIEFQSLRVPIDASWCSMTARPECLRLFGRESLSSQFEQSLVARRVDSFEIKASTCVEFSPTSFQQMAGLVCYYNTSHWYYLNISGDESGKKLLRITSCNRHVVEEILETPIDVSGTEKVYLEVCFVRERIAFGYSLDGQDWKSINADLDGSILSDDYVRDEGNRYRPAFTGSFVGLCCQDLTGQNQHADFHHFDYSIPNQENQKKLSQR